MSLLRRTGPAPQQGSVHLGLGAFFRAHGAVYTQDAAEPGWGILGVSLRSPKVRDQLAGQDWLYTAVERGPEGDRPRVVEQLTGVLCAPEDPGAVVAALASPETKLVTLTVTEKGYCHDPATGALNRHHPDILADLAGQPRSALGYLVAGLAARLAAGLAPFTVLSCDNIPANGRVPRGLVLELAKLQNADLADWIEDKGRFPSSMVDRIVPATTQADLDGLEGVQDQSPVFHEPFRQWVIEDSFVGNERPPWERADAQIVKDVEPFEAMKLRMLNGAHSALAYLGPIAGHKTVAEAVGDPLLAQFLTKMWEREVIPTLIPPQETDLQAYGRALLERFANPALHHKLAQIAMDGSQKLPQRLLASLAETPHPAPCLILAVAAWMRHVAGLDRAIPVQDPLADQLLSRVQGASDAASMVDALLRETAVFGDAYWDHKEALTQAYHSLDQGASSALTRALKQA